MNARAIATGLLLAATYVSAAAAAQVRPDLSGTWVLDRAGGNMPRRAVKALESGARRPITVAIVQTSTTFTITRTVDGRRVRAAFPLNGRRASQPTPEGTMTSRAAFRGRELVIRGERPFSGTFGTRQVPFVQVHELSRDGSRMTVTLTLDTPLGEKTRRVVLRRGSTAPPRERG